MSSDSSSSKSFYWRPWNGFHEKQAESKVKVGYPVSSFETRVSRFVGLSALKTSILGAVAFCKTRRLLKSRRGNPISSFQYRGFSIPGRVTRGVAKIYGVKTMLSIRTTSIKSTMEKVKAEVVELESR